ncbi:MAG: hypothetical protein HY819_18875 [Acidobacteria bacterium]|nr:hypothetical protein [Acidobacteriota bacterium]
MIQLPEFTTEGAICQNFKQFGFIVLLLIALVFPFNYQYLRNLEKSFDKIAQKKQLSLLLVALLAFIGAASVSFLFYWPIPYVHDEYSYLLAADTFAHARLTNPPHPMWKHFETFYVIQQPSYMSKYPPGQGLILALGQVLTGYPIVGVWFSMALACASTCWMLQVWIKPRWALMGGFLMILKLGLFSYWSQNFWGGAVAATGGAILLGALRKIIKEPKWFNSLLFGLGLGILANSRPYEGFIFSLPAIIYLLFWMKGKKSPQFKVLLKEIILPLAIILLVIGFMIGYYNFVITGKVWLMPFQLYENIYANVSNFLWFEPRQVKFNHKEFELVAEEMFLNLYNLNKGLSNLISYSFIKLKNLWSFFLGISFSILLIALPLLRKNFWVKFALLNLVILLVGMLQVLISFPHYMAPATCLVYFLVLQSMRRVSYLRWKNKPVGRLMVWMVPLYCILLILLPISLKTDPFACVNPAYWEVPKAYLPTWMVKRQEIISKLSEGNDRYLILVKYLPSTIHNEWVYNEADIDNSKVIWARSMSFEENCRLIKYYSDRKVAFIELGEEPDVIKRYYAIKGCE